MHEILYCIIYFIDFYNTEYTHTGKIVMNERTRLTTINVEQLIFVQGLEREDINSLQVEYCR